jgi:hypothetical protein
MPTKHPRINIVFNQELLSALKLFAIKKHQSISNAAQDLIAQALELQEDYALSKLAEKRLANSKGWVKHEDAWQ